MIKKIKNLDKNFYLPALGGFLGGLSYSPSPLPYLIFFCFGPLFAVINNENSLKKFLFKVYLWGFFFNVVSIYWVGGWESKTDPFLMIGGTVLVFFNPLTFFIPFVFYWLAKKSVGQKFAILSLPFFWALYEFAYMATDASFPWLVLGNALANFTVFIQIADIVGSVGLSIIVIFLNAFFYFVIDDYVQKKKFNPYAAIISIIVILSVGLYGIWKIENYIPSKEKITVGVVQPNLDPWKKWEYEDKHALLDIYLNLSAKAIDQDAKFIIWPETALNLYLLNGFNDDLVARIKKFVDSNQVCILTGMPHIEYHRDLSNLPFGVKHNKTAGIYYATYNGAFLFAPLSDEIQKYGKMKLVPFGEKVPFVEYFPALADFIRWEVGLSGWNNWREQTVFAAKIEEKEVRFNCLICYESVYPFFTADFFKDKELDFLTVITNDSWYGYSSGPFQHRDFAKLRAVENRRAIARCANGGISCYINPLGKIEAQTKLFESDVLSFELELRNDKTFFTKHPYLIIYFSAIASFISLFVSIAYLAIKKKRK